MTACIPKSGNLYGIALYWIALLQLRRSTHRGIPGKGASNTDTLELTPLSIADVFVINILRPLKMGLALKLMAFGPVPA